MWRFLPTFCATPSQVSKALLPFVRSSKYPLGLFIAVVLYPSEHLHLDVVAELQIYHQTLVFTHLFIPLS